MKTPPAPTSYACAREGLPGRCGGLAGNRSAAARLLPLLLLLAAAPAASDDQPLYKWQDAQGRTHYGDRPPPGAERSVQGYQLPLSVDPPASPGDDDYSIENQLKRLEEDRKQREEARRAAEQERREGAERRAEQAARARAERLEEEAVRDPLPYPLPYPPPPARQPGLPTPPPGGARPTPLPSGIQGPGSR